MESLEAELERARDLDVADLADAIESIGFECTRCGGCCTGEAEEPHTATVFPDEVRQLRDSEDYDWRDVARPMPFGLDDAGGGAGESSGDVEAGGTTFEWALQTDACGDCAFYEEREEAAPDSHGPGHCTVHEDRPLICQTYPFSLALGGTSQPMGEAVDEAGLVRAHECEGLGRDIDRADAVELAETLRERAIRELEEAIGVRSNYEPVDAAPGEVVVHDSEGAKDPDGRPLGTSGDGAAADDGRAGGDESAGGPGSDR